MADAYYVLRGLTAQIGNSVLRDLVCYFLDDPEFRKASGGSTHHNYEGGLVDHTLEVTQMSMGIYESCSVKELISRDFLITGAILHDVGKIAVDFEEYRYAGSAHCSVGAHLVSEACKKFNLSDYVRKLLVGLVIEHGAPGFYGVKYSTRESFIVYTADTLSAGVCAKDTCGKDTAAMWDTIQVVNI